MNPKNPKKKKYIYIYISKTEHNLYLCHKKIMGGEERHTLKGSTKSSITECTGSKKITEIGWRRRSSEQ